MQVSVADYCPISLRFSNAHIFHDRTTITKLLSHTGVVYTPFTIPQNCTNAECLSRPWSLQHSEGKSSQPTTANVSNVWSMYKHAVNQQVIARCCGSNNAYMLLEGNSKLWRLSNLGVFVHACKRDQPEDLQDLSRMFILRTRAMLAQTGELVLPRRHLKLCPAWRWVF